MQPGRKVVMLATNAFGLGIDKPDIRYIIHYQMPGSPEAYVQEAGRAGRDGKPARCVLLFQPDDIAIQEHFLKEAHPTKAQARMVAEGLYAWSDEGKEVSVRDLALSMALPERRVRVILSVLEAMGVAEEVKAARWKGVEPKPTREQIDKAAIGVRGAAHLGPAAAGVVAGVHEHAEVPRADAARLLRRARRRASAGCAIRTRGSTARCSIRRPPTSATGCTRRPTFTRGRGAGGGDAAAGYETPMAAGGAGGATAAPCSRQRFRATCCRRCRRSRFRRRPTASRPSTKGCGRRPTRARASRCPATRSSTWRARSSAAPAQAHSGGGRAPRRPRPRGLQHRLGGGARRQHPTVCGVARRRAGDAACPGGAPGRERRPPGNHPGHHGHGGGQAAAAAAIATCRAGGGGPGGRFDGGGGGGRRRRRRGGSGASADATATATQQRRDHHRHRDRERGPAAGVYNPGGD